MAHVADRWFKTTADGEKVPTDRHGRGKRWQSVWIDPFTKREKTASFATKVEAERHNVGIESSKARGEYVAPNLGRVTVETWSSKWIDSKTRVKESTLTGYVSMLNTHVLPKWGSVPLADIGHEDVQTWIGEMAKAGHKPRTIVKAHGVLSQMLRYAVKARRISWNPAKDVELPSVESKDKRYLTVEQAFDLADAASPVWDVATRQPTTPGRLAVLILAFTGIRWGELAALKVKRVDLLRRRLHVAENVVEVNGKLLWGLPKNHERRWVPIPQFFVDDFARHLEDMKPNDLVFPSARGDVLRVNNARRGWLNSAVIMSGAPNGLHPHELRHTAASIAVSAGANVKAVQRMLGHKKASMTLDVYADLFDSDLEAVAERVDEIVRRAIPLTDQPRTQSKITRLPVGAVAL